MQKVEDGVGTHVLEVATLVILLGSAVDVGVLHHVSMVQTLE